MAARCGFSGPQITVEFGQNFTYSHFLLNCKLGESIPHDGEFGQGQDGVFTEFTTHAVLLFRFCLSFLWNLTHSSHFGGEVESVARGLRVPASLAGLEPPFTTELAVEDGGRSGV